MVGLTCEYNIVYNFGKTINLPHGRAQMLTRLNKYFGRSLR